MPLFLGSKFITYFMQGYICARFIFDSFCPRCQQARPGQIPMSQINLSLITTVFGWIQVMGKTVCKSENGRVKIALCTLSDI